MISGSRDLRTHLLDVPLNEIDESWLGELIGFAEGLIFDVKSQMYGNGEQDRRELATDVAAMANASGGVIVVGATEVNGLVDALVPIEADDYEPRVRQILANNISPTLFSVDVLWVESTDDLEKGFLVLRVQPSTHRPHAVQKRNDLRFPVRDGSTTRYMGVAEVEREMRSRREAQVDLVERSLDGLSKVEAHRDVVDGGAWLVTSFVPARKGFMRITRDRLREVGSWMGEMERQLPGLAPWRSPIVGSERFVCGDFQRWRDQVEGFYGVRSLAAEFCTDGRSSLLSRVSPTSASEVPDLDVAEPGITIWDELLALSLLHQLALAGDHMRRCGAGGDVSIACRVVSDGEAMAIQHNRQHWWDMLQGTRPVNSMEPVLLSCEATELLQPSRLVEWSSILGDLLVNCFGAPHLPQFEGGVINESMFNSTTGGWSHCARLKEWERLHLQTDPVREQ